MYAVFYLNISQYRSDNNAALEMDDSVAIDLEPNILGENVNLENPFLKKSLTGFSQNSDSTGTVV